MNCCVCDRKEYYGRTIRVVKDKIGMMLFICWFCEKSNPGAIRLIEKAKEKEVVK
jgi:hypothetical protein